MNELIKKGLYIGLGATLASKEKLEKYLGELTKNGDIASQEAKSILEAIGEKGKEKKTEWSDNFKQELKEAVQSLGFVTKEEFEQLQQRVAKLEESTKKNNAQEK
ncbi:hypothetical protein QS257_12460 [Terrilactibacillus sp. S3-3]|nr:hypothetical protein QS257_12460 [Terrilactibacillus sp. S3-3]